MVYSHYPINEQTIVDIQEQYLRDSKPWFLGFSGGKDSSALLKLVYIALLNLKHRPKPVTVIYCDTGVDIPVIQSLVTQTLRELAAEAEQHELPIHIERAAPKLKDTYFVKVIGRGYPPPSNKFRWCTNRLRIDPVKRVLASTPGKSTVLLGIRRGESLERDRTISKHETDNKNYFKHTNNKSLIYSPIVNYTVEEVWNTLTFNPVPESLDVNALFALYREAGGECPIVRDPKGTPCGKGRFGCWTCTVVRKDRAVKNLIEEGHHNLVPLFEFRNWLAEVRDLPEYRCRRRRNGDPGPGPFTLRARQEILEQLLSAQKRSSLPLLAKDELRLIEELWVADRTSPHYVEV